MRRAQDSRPIRQNRHAHHQLVNTPVPIPFPNCLSLVTSNRCSTALTPPSQFPELQTNEKDSLALLLDVRWCQRLHHTRTLAEPRLEDAICVLEHAVL